MFRPVQPIHWLDLGGVVATVGWIGFFAGILLTMLGGIYGNVALIVPGVLILILSIGFLGTRHFRRRHMFSSGVLIRQQAAPMDMETANRQHAIGVQTQQFNNLQADFARNNW
jgi:hypothetical protein